MLSRRRKLRESPGPVGSPAPPPPPTPPTPLAGDEERPLSVSGRRLRGRRRALREVAQASESCAPVSKSAEEMCLYKTPKRLLQSSFRSPVFSSPCNDNDGPQEIFWDPNSPTTCQLDERRNKQHDRRCSVAISDIVNRIAPQGEKPTTDSLLDMWIGEGAIPCTPGITKIKSRTRTNYVKFKAQSSEEELIKLAKQFDKNMVELDVRQEQDSETYDFVQTVSEAETLNNYKDEAQLQTLQSISDEVPEVNIAVTVKGNSSISKEEHYKNSSLTNFDPSAEAALTALFDGSTQKCSGQLSQGLSNASFTTSHNICGKNDTLKEEIDNSIETVVTERQGSKISGQQNLTSVAVTSASDSFVMATSSIAKSEILTKPGEIEAGMDFDDDDDWEHMLTDDSFVMQISQAPELLITDSSQPTIQKDIFMLTASKSDEPKVGINGDLTIGKSVSKNLQVLPSETNNKNVFDPTKALFPLKSNNEPMELIPTENEVKYEKNFSKTSFPTKIPSYSELSVASNIQKTKEAIYPKFGSNMKVSAKESALGRRPSNFQSQTRRDSENPPNCYQSFNVPTKINPNNSLRISNETTFCNLNKKDASKQCSLFDDWNDPKLASEVIEACHELEKSWNADDDDDLLYQACDHVEKLTQQQDLEKDKQGSENQQKVNYNSYLGMETNNTVTSEKEYHLLQSKHLNRGDFSAHGTSVREVIETGKLTCKEGKNYRSSANSTDTKNLSKNYQYPNYQNNNQHVSWNNSNVAVGVNKSSILTGNLSLAISKDHKYTDTASSRNLHNQILSHSTVTTETHVNKTSIPTPSGYSFTKIKNPQTFPHLSHSSIPSRSISDSKILQHSEKSKTQFVNSLLGETMPQQLLKRQFSESCELPIKEEEEKNRKYSPEEIQRKRQEALVRRMSKTRTSFINAAHT
ncbi:ewing's tumor-associated antigen 1 isoform X1 [Sarcophilus harrisii]|uniref:ETAA1 activator of ATR kinase n=1 Tax=Sarcophilus harrisii TaxID=9305 RepID=G3WIM6_SARHA|nr:ewing's tumor-associated antigen 1 isoform X1 [Sarcophilus harrisii]